MPERLASVSSFLRSARGNAATEFAFIAPAFVLVILGTLDFGRLWWQSSTLKHAATEASRYAAIRGAEKPQPATLEDIQAYVRSRAVGLDPTALEIGVTWSPNNNPGSTVNIELSYPFDFLMIGFLPLEPIQLKGGSTMIIG